MAIKFNGFDVVDVPTSGLYLAVDIYKGNKDTSGNLVKNDKAIILPDANVDKNQKIGRMTLADGTKLAYIMSEGKPASDSGSKDLKTVWSVDFTMKNGKARVTEPLKDYLTAAQLADITDESAGGPNFDGNNRTIAVYFLGEETTGKMMPEPLLMNWADTGSKTDEAMKTKLTAAGFTPMVDAPSTMYLLDGDAILSMDIPGNHAFKMRIAKLSTPISNS